MAFPARQTTAVTTGSGTSAALTIPAGIVADDLLVVKFGSDGSSSHTMDSAWNEIKNAADGTGNVRHSVGWRKATADANDDITMGIGASQAWGGIIHRIDGHEDPSTQPPEVSTGASSLAQINPDLSTPTGGSKDYLFLANGTRDFGNDPPTAAPTDYSNFLIANVSGGPGVCVCSAERQLTATSENPGPFATGRNDEAFGCTVAVHPAGVGPPNWIPRRGSFGQDARLRRYRPRQRQDDWAYRNGLYVRERALLAGA